MKLTSKQFTEICADVSADNVNEALTIAETLGSKSLAAVAGVKKLILHVMFCQKLEKALGITDEGDGVEVTEEAFDKAADVMSKEIVDETDTTKDALVRSLEAILFCSALKRRLFGKEKDDESNKN